MLEEISYRKQLLFAIEAFLEATPVSVDRGHEIVRNCLTAISREETEMTLDWFIWYRFFYALTDSVFYANKRHLHIVSNVLQGKQPQPMQRYIYQDDFRAYFTESDSTWYRQLEHLLDFLQTLPFSELHAFFSPSTQEQEPSGEILSRVPEEIMNRIAQMQATYEQQTLPLEQMVQDHPPAEDVGKEKMPRFIIHIVTALLTGLYVGWQAVYSGYPVVYNEHVTIGGTLVERRLGDADATEDLLRAKNLLEALAGQRPLSFAWSVCKVSSFDGEAILFQVQ